MLQNATFLRKSAPWPPNTSDDLWWTCLLYCACEAKCMFADLLQMYHACQRFWNCDKTLTFCSVLARCRIPCACHAKTTSERPKVLRNVLRAAAACTFSTSQLPKMFRDRQFLTLLTSKFASRHNGVHFFDISTSKSGPRPLAFKTVDFEMCFAPQRLAIFAALARLLFDPPEQQIIGKTEWIATLPPFRAPASSFLWLFLFSYLLSSSLFFSGYSNLCFSTCPYCRKFGF